jgi:serine/threonine protein kinase
MTPQRWQQISAIYQQAAARTAKDRDAYVIHACGADTELRREVEALLAQGESFLALACRLPPGSRIGAYELLEVVGAGGMGIVYRARDLKLQRDVALKVLPDAVALDPERVARFRREATVLASLNHPNIGAIYGFEDSATCTRSSWSSSTVRRSPIESPRAQFHWTKRCRLRGRSRRHSRRRTSKESSIAT